MTSTLASRGRDHLDLARYHWQITGNPLLQPVELLARVPEVGRFAHVEPDLDFYGDPPHDGAELWRALVRRVNEGFAEDSELDGAVVVHGTNTLEETAYFLHLTVKTHNPVVVVGAQRPITAISSDGPLNLVNAVRVAAAPDSKGKGVLIVLNDQISSARFVGKTNTYRLETFHSWEFGFLGFADADRVVYYQAPLRRHTLDSEFDVTNVSEFSRVDILYAFAGDDGTLVEAAVDAGASGIVVAGVGAGSTNRMKDALAAVAKRGVVVVRSHRLFGGRVLTDDNWTAPGFVSADNLSPQKARVLLLLALTKTRNPAEIQRMFDTY